MEISYPFDEEAILRAYQEHDLMLLIKQHVQEIKEASQQVAISRLVQNDVDGARQEALAFAVCDNLLRWLSMEGVSKG